MKELLEALNLLWKYLKDPEEMYPTSCNDYVMRVHDVNLPAIPLEDIHRLAILGFTPGCEEDNLLTSYFNENGDYMGDVDFATISQEEWDSIKYDLNSCFISYAFGSN